MTTESDVRLPQWLLDASTGETTEGPSRKRTDTREQSPTFAYIRPLDEPDAKPVGVHVSNLSASGVGFVTRMQFFVGTRLLLLEDDEMPDAADTVALRVVHCTQTIQGYKIGCTFEGA